MRDALQQALEEAVARHGVPGAAAGVLLGDEAITAATGTTNVEHPLPVDDATLFQVGSITKTFTSAAVLQLVEEGLVGLDDPVGRHLPDLAERTGLDADRITVEHLLSHQAGFDGDHLFVSRVPDDVGALAGARRLFEPGTGFSYNNAGFSLAGLVIEAASGEPFAAYVREHLLGPLGMATACFTADDAITHRVAAPHAVLDGTPVVLRGAGWQPGWELGPVDLAAGGLVASVGHLLAWARFQRTGEAADGTRLLSDAGLRRLHEPVVEADAVERIALDWHVRSPGGTTTIEHGGLIVGYCSILVVAPEVAVVVLTHATNGGAVNQDVRRWALREAGIDETDPEPDPALEVDVEALAGRYLYPFAALDVAPGDEPGTLRITPSRRDDVDGWRPPPDPPVTVAFFTDRDAVAVDAPGPVRRRVRFGDGWVQYGGRRCPRV